MSSAPYGVDVHFTYASVRSMSGKADTSTLLMYGYVGKRQVAQPSAVPLMAWKGTRGLTSHISASVVHGCRLLSETAISRMI